MIDYTCAMYAETDVCTQEFYGYMYFDDPDWCKGFSISQTCASAIDAFRAAIALIHNADPNQHSYYAEAVCLLHETSERIANHMQWHTRKNIALMLGLAQLYETAAQHIVKVDFHAGYIRSYMQQKAASVHSLLSRMHDLPCRDGGGTAWELDV